MKTTVVHCHDKFDIYVGRPLSYPNIKDERIRKGSILHNPFSIKAYGSRERVIAMYEAYAKEKMKINPKFATAIRACRGKILGCWCKPEACHGDVIAKLADRMK